MHADETGAHDGSSSVLCSSHMTVSVSVLSLRAGEAAPTAGGALAGCWFTLAALAGDSGERDRVQRQVRQNGGRVFDERRTKLVVGAGAQASAFAICPFGFPSALQTAARRHADFRLGPRADLSSCALHAWMPWSLLCFVLRLCTMPFLTRTHGHPTLVNQPPRCQAYAASKLCHWCAVSEENWRTPFWVDLCQEAGMVLRKLRRDQVTCRPLPVPVPLAGMQGVRCVPCLCCPTSPLLFSLQCCVDPRPTTLG